MMAWIGTSPVKEMEMRINGHRIAVLECGGSEEGQHF
jgi:hypothetical protein